MTEAEVQAFCANNGISVSPVGQPLHVVDPTELPASVRKFVNDDGTYKGGGKSEPEGEAAEEGGEQGATETASTADETSVKEEPRVASKQSTKKGARKADGKK